MKRLIAKNISLKRKCSYCDRVIAKGEVYYKERTVYIDDYYSQRKVCTNDSIICPKCKYGMERHNKRHSLFVDKCEHPKWAVETQWSYIPGECVKEPDHDECRLCGKVVL